MDKALWVGTHTCIIQCIGYTLASFYKWYVCVTCVVCNEASMHNMQFNSKITCLMTSCNSHNLFTYFNYSSL